MEIAVMISVIFREGRGCEIGRIVGVYSGDSG